MLRAAEAAAAAAQAAAAAAQAASLPAAGERPAAGEPAPPERSAGPPPVRAHALGAPARLLAAAGELEVHVAQARAQLDALEDALRRLEGDDGPGE